MNAFNNLKIGTKIFLGFLIVLILLGFISGVTIFQLTRIKTTVIDLADNLAKDQHLSDKMVAKILLVRFYANKYIQSHKSEDLVRFNQEFAYFEKLLVEADAEITKDERVKMLIDIKMGVQEYGKNVAEVIQLVDKRNKILVEELNVQGPLAAQKLEQLRKQAKDAIASLYAGNAQRALLLMRLDVFKYLEEGNIQWIEQFEKRYQEAQVAFKKINEVFQEPTHRQLAQEAQTATNQYYQSFIGLQADYARQNQIIETQLNVIGPQIRKKSSEMSASVTLDFDANNKAIQTLVTKTRWQLLLIMILAILISLGLVITISRNITIPLATLMRMSHWLTGGNMTQMLEVKNRNEMNQITARQDEIGNIGQAYDTLANYFKTVIEDIVQVSQGLAVGNLHVIPQADYQGDFVQIKSALQTGLSDLRSVIEDIVQVSQGLAAGNLHIMPTAEYSGDFVQIKNALETALSDLGKVIEDIVQISQQLAEGSQNVTAQAEYRGDFIQIKNALEIATNKLAEATAQNAIQNWFKTGQTLLNEQISGEQDVISLAKNIITFLTTYLEAQVGVFYLIEEGKRGAVQEERFKEKRERGEENVSKDTRLKLLASYAYTQRKGIMNEFQVGEGLIGQAALEKQKILVTDVPEDYLQIQSGLGEAMPQQILVIPFLYENVVKGVIEIGSFHEFTKIQLEWLEQVMPNIGITINTAESRTKMQTLLSVDSEQ